MGLLSGAMIGGAGGFGEGLAKSGELGWKDEHERMKEQAQSEREARNLALTHPPELREYYAAHAREADARARALGTDKKETKTMKLIPLKDETGNIIALQDENSDLRAVPTPGQPAKEGSAPWYTFGLGIKEGAQPAIPPGVDWYDGAGQRVAGPQVRYPDMVRRGAGSGTGIASAPNAPASTAPAPASRPPLTSFMGNGNTQAAPAQAPARAPVQPQAQAVAKPAPESASGGAVDAARSKLATANSALQVYGLKQRQRDPHGFTMAQQAAAEAKRELDAAMTTYQNELGPMGAATYRTK